MQGSLLLFPVRSAFSPYVGGGIGVYSQTQETLNAIGVVTASTTEKKIGRFVKFGDATAGSEPINIPGGTVFPALKSVHLSHQGSMWTSGVAFYF